MQRIAPNVYRLTGLIAGNVYVLVDRDGLTLIDTSIASSGPLSPCHPVTSLWHTFCLCNIPSNVMTKGTTMAQWLVYGAGLGVALGAVIGILLDNVALGIGIGVAIGAALGGAVMAARDKQQ